MKSEDLESLVNDFKSENELLNRIETTNKPAFVVYYNPGDFRWNKERRKVQKLAKKYCKLVKKLFYFLFCEL